MPTRRWGPEVIANTSAAGRQSSPRVAALTGGGFVVAWRDDAVANPSVRLQRFDAGGARLGGEITVSADAEPGSEIAVAGTAEGGFLVAWVSGSSPAAGTVETKVYAANGTLLRTQPAIIDSELVANPEVARLGTGMAVLWERPASGYPALRLLDVAGQGGFVHPDIIPEIAPTPQPGIAVAANADASRLAVVLYIEYNGLHLQLYDPSGTMVGNTSFTPESTHNLTYSDFAVAWASDGMLAVGWKETNSETGLDTLWLRYVPVTGSPPFYSLHLIGSAVRLKASQSGQLDGLVLTGLPAGGTVASWIEQGVLQLQGFDVAGNRLGGEMRVNPPGEFAASPSVAALPDGRVAVAWQGPDDADAGEIHLQIVDPRDGIVTGTAADDTLYGNDLANDEITGGTGNDRLYGLRGDDLLLGGDGNDRLDGGAGADEMRGGRGDDLYIVDSESDMPVELHRQGNDTVQTGAFGIDLSLYPYIENATLLGPLGRFARGTNGANILNGEASSAGNALTGMGGNDTYIVGAGDVVGEAIGGGIDTVQSSTINLNLATYGGVENITLLGTRALTATGNNGANTIDGSRNPAANVLTGQGGNDTFIVGPGDTIVEVVGGGTDTVQSALISLALASYPGVQNITLTGALPLAATGDTRANVLDGARNSAANVLTGRAGNDIYVVGPGDTVVEQAGGGNDTVRSTLIPIILANYPNVENAALWGSEALSIIGTNGANVLTGNAGANTLAGHGGGDTFIGLGGTDTLVGGAGADRFRFLAPADSAVGAACDVIQAFNAAEADRIDLAAIDANVALAGDQAFVFLGTAAFTGAPGELRYDVAGADLILRGTIAGTTPAFEIRLAGLGTLAAGDITL